MIYDNPFIEDCNEILQLVTVNRIIESSIKSKQNELDNTDGVCNVLSCELEHLKDTRQEVLYKIADIIINEGNVAFSFLR